jgi:hypothetical protein
VIQVGVTLGAIAGGIAVDTFGTSAPLYVTATCAVLAAMLIATQRPPDGASQKPAAALAPAEWAKVRRLPWPHPFTSTQNQWETNMPDDQVYAVPEVVDRATFQAELDALRVR